MKSRYPKHAFQTKRLWLQTVRKRWIILRNTFRAGDSIMLGSAYYPKDVYKWLRDFEKMDKIMKEYYKNA